MAKVLSTIDHFMWAAVDLQTACNEFEGLTGVTPAFGGVHPGFGTHNALASLDNGRYVEILALDPEQNTDHPLAKQIALLASPAILAFHIQRQDLESAARIYENAGMSCTGPFDLERKRPDGEILKWRLLIPESEEFGRAVPIFIDWMNAPHPAASSPKGCNLVYFEVAHPQHENLMALYEELEVGIAITHSIESTATAKLTTPKGEVVLRGLL